MEKKKKKTMFITVSRAIIARNILLNDFFSRAAEAYNIVLLTPEYDDAEFRRRFGAHTIEPLFLRELTGWRQKMDKLMVAIHKALIYNPTIEVRTKYGIMCREDVRFKFVRHIIQKYLFGMVLSRIPGLRRFLKWIDGKIFFSNTVYHELIERYRPDVVFITNIADDGEVQLLRDCQRAGVLSVGMVKSWDSTSKFGFRGKTDIFMVWGEYMKNELLQFQGYAEKDIHIVGVPQFDIYSKAPTLLREEFFAKYGMDPNRPFLFFGSEGPVCEDDEYIISLLRERIKDGDLSGYQLLIRPHFGYRSEKDRFAALADGETVFVDDDYTYSNFIDGMELGFSSIENLIAAVRYSSAVITSASTLVLDSIANGKYPILYGFDKQKHAPEKDSVRRLYTTHWFEEIGRMGLENIAYTEADFLSLIKKVIKHPDIKKTEREKTIQYFCRAIDGKSGDRLFKTIDAFVSGAEKRTYQK